jgi:hypothetical protein
MANGEYQSYVDQWMLEIWPRKPFDERAIWKDFMTQELSQAIWP